MTARTPGDGQLAWPAARLEDPDLEPDDLRSGLADLLARDEARGIAIALAILARPPRIKPSRGLVIDPGDGADRRWRQRVAAGRALLHSPASARIADELADELADDPDLAAEVRSG